ncbi:TonB-dependent receptor plug domain-containing protein [Undibacterium terreum]|uniref:TonB system transporter n=1 Tax=Undibacterium terreum TaxID=1224302 RepID=A0A916URD0_9BURK|nr:TonB-dependent receptor [Undibacterium terreum]GGC84515.1 TonB system transporter [Undibacterium terreum]
MIFQEKASAKSVRLALSILAGSAFIAGNVHAQEAVSADKAQRVEITGSNIKRTEKEGTVAIQTISAQDIKNSGATTVLDLLKAAVPGLGTGGFNDTPNQNGFSKGVATADLRNLGSTSTLILLNGRRMTPSAFANPNNGQSTLYDLNSIPISALERVEVLKDGASAIYGSDAIGGVINFITKRDYQGGEFTATAGANDDGRFGRQNINGFFGLGDFNKDGYNVFATIDFSQRQAVSKKDGVNDIEQGLYGAINNRLTKFNGTALANGASNSSTSAQPFFYRETLPGSAAFTTGSTVVNRTNCDPANIVTGTAANGVTSGTLFNRKFCVFDTDNYAQVQGKTQDISFLTRGELKLGENASAYAEAAMTKSDRWYVGAPITINGRTPVTNFTSTGLAAPFQAILPIGHPDNPFTDVRAAAVYRFENLSGDSQQTTKNYRLVGGVKGTNFGIDWDTGILWNKSDVETITDGTLYLPVLRQITTRSLASLAADPNISRNTLDKGSAEILQWDAKGSTEFGQLGGGAIGVAAGVEFRKEKISITPDADKAAGNIYGYANTIIDGERNVGSAFVEFRAPFTKNFEVDIAGRGDKYPDIKTNFVPKVGAKWTVNDSVAFRGGYSEGFRAPALSQVTPGGAQFFQPGLQDPKRCPNGNDPAPGADTVDCNKSVSGTGGANPNLKPETSRSYTFGVILSPTKNFDVTLDWYKVRKLGEVILTDAQFTVNHEADNPGNVVRDTNPANFLKDANGNVIPNSGPLLSVKEPWINQGATETSGIDIDLKYRSNLGEWGTLTTGLSATYVMSYRRAEQAGDVEANVVGANGGISDWATQGGDIPRLKARFSANWTKNEHNVYGAINFVDSISLMRNTDGNVTYPAPYCYYGTGQPQNDFTYSLGGLPNYSKYFKDCKVPTWTTFDLGYRYTGIKNLTLGLSIANLFDTKAPYDPRYYANGYNDSLHNNTGRYFTVSANYKFR